MRVRAAPKEHLPWVEERTGCVLTREARGIEAIDSAGRIRAMVAYDGWTENSVQAHMAIDAPAFAKAILRPAFEYPFLECGKGLVIGIIPSHNAKSVGAARAMGFTEAHRVRDGWSAGDDLIVFELRRESCRWLGKEG